MAGDGYRVGVLGATGLVGSTILERARRARLPGRRGGPVRLRALGRQGDRVERRRRSPAGRSSEDSIQGLDLVLSSAGGAVSAEWAPKLVEAGAIVVDNTSYWRMHDDVPLVVAEVNPEAARGPQGDRRQPQLLDDADGRGAEAAPRRGRDRAPRRLHLPGRLRHRQGGDRRAARRSRGPSSTARRPPRRDLPAPDRLQRARRRPAASPTATTTPTRSAS